MISVIVPSYNVDSYLERCVKSLVNQTYRDLEIILVDDGSTDHTGALCDRLGKTDTRIRVIHKVNGGLSDARNAGIEIARGEFYSFIDGDDFIDHDTYEVMMKEMQDKNVSIVSGGFYVTGITGEVRITTSDTKCYLTKEEAFRDLFGDMSYLTQSSCNKLFRKELFEHIRYTKGILNEDMEILPRLLDKCKGVMLLDRPIYHYIKKPGSITSSAYSMERYRTIEIEKDIYKMCKNKYPELQPYAAYYELKSLYEMLENLINSSNRTDFERQEILLRIQVLKGCIRCMRWKDIRVSYADQIKNYFIYSFFGVSGVKKIVEIKKMIVRIIKR